MSLRTILLDPSNDQANRRTIFRLPEGIYPSNLKLLNVGCTTSDATAREYNNLTGILSIVRQIQLMDGATVLDSIDRANIWNSFKSYNKGNDNNRDLQKNLRKNNLGFGLEPETLKITTYYTPEKATNDSTTSAQGWVDLSDMFSFLKQIKYIDSVMFPNFQVVIEYETDKSVWLAGSGISGGSTLEPLIVAEEINDPEFSGSIWSDFKGMNYVSYEVDTVRLDAVLPTSSLVQKQQNETFRFNGFNGKILNRCLLSKNALTAADSRASATYKQLGSEAQSNQVIQLRVNGSQIFPRSGIVDNNERLAVLHDVWGTLNTIPSAGSLPFVNSVNYVVDNTNKLGHLDYYGANIGYKIEDLQLDYQRSGAYDSTLATQDIGKYNQSLDMHLFGEVMKRLTYSNGKYVIAYM